ncbi:MarR family transcriptional regulator [Halodesulfurarchaeum sp. HSR-GB]|uniref:helix-turn-helix transcriptional regulator n=1 Tax=Halodesulfurarchaeum sp. HSR-GB TaxID=3074077 RepID=UPI00285524A7|nr:MarR family transcriptional regulator [Halodesulfurarchaeum sp. HSR-GB]MDR5655634.1 MarR family transcriptional regulator [Halodesulfurarchaeum sp. HSR-GB]
MNRRRADRLAAIVVGAVLLLGGLWTWDRYQAQQAFDSQMDGMMGSMMDGMGTTQGADPLVIAVGTLVVAGVLGGGYLVLRDEWTEPETQAAPQMGTSDIESAAHEPDEESTDVPTDATSSVESVAGLESQRALLDLLPEDERRILEPVLESPGLTQIEVRDRSDFSKSKVSQTISDLEKRGLVYREKQGRTYRVYPAEQLPGVTE